MIYKHKNLIYTILIIALITTSILLIPQNTNTTTKEDNNKKEITKEQTTNNNKETATNENSDSRGSNSETEEGNNGGGEGSSEESQNSCTEKQIAYSLKHFNEEITCKEYNLNGCTNIQANCSVEVHNLDKETTGTFSMRFDLIQEENTINSQENTKNLEPKKSAILGANWELTNEEGINENLECDFTTTNIPTKKEC